MADGKLLSPKDELTLRAMRMQLASMRRELDLVKRRRERAQRRGDDFVGIGRITDSDAIVGESNRWQYDITLVEEDTGESVLTYIDTATEITAQNLAEVHNDGSGQESNGVMVGSGGGAVVSLIPIMNDRPVRVYRRAGNGGYYIDVANDVEVTCDGGSESAGAVADSEEVLRARLFG